MAFYYCDTPPVSNELPAAELLGEVKTPDVLEYWIQLLAVKALGHGTTLSYGDCQDENSGKNYEVFKLESQRGGFAKFELEVPASGKYKLYLSYFKGPDYGRYAINQRQIPVRTSGQARADKHAFVQREYMGILDIEQGTNTITVVLKDDLQRDGSNAFLLHRIYLERNDNEEERTSVEN